MGGWTTDPGGLLVGWLLTYLLHSTVLLGAAWVVSRAARGEAWRETLWRTALLGGMVTASAQLALGLSPLVGRYAMPLAPSETVAPRAASLERAAPEAAAPGELTREAESARARPAVEPVPAAAAIESAPAAPSPPAASETRAEVPSVPAARVPLQTVLLGGWVLVALALIGRLFTRHVRLRRLLCNRQQVASGGLPEVLAGLRRNAGYWKPVWLTQSTRAPSPLALGMREICVPDRFLDELGPAEQRAALAHELAHLTRRDPAWQLVVGVVEAVLWVQPLNRVARRELRAAAEHLCDDWAVRQTGSELELARCLAQVASWVAPGREPIPEGTMAMAEGGSPLLQRVERILARRAEPAARSPLLRGAAALALLITVAGVAPAVTPGGPSPLPLDDDRRAAGEAGEADTVRVVRTPEPGAPLTARWSWAESAAAAAGERAYWIAYAAPGRVPGDQSMNHDSDPLRVSELRSVPVVERLGVADAVREVAPADGSAALLLFRVIEPRAGGPQIERVALRSPDAGMRLDGAVYWLGAVPAAESASWLWDLYGRLTPPALREAVLEAMGLHADSRVAYRLRQVIDDPRAGPLREEAVEALEWHPSDRTVALLRMLALKDAMPEVRVEAAETLGQLRHPGAAAALRELAYHPDADPGMRQEAVESLGDRGDPEVVEVLFRVAREDPEMRVAREAAETLGSLPADLVLPRLRSLAWEAPLAEVQREAVETLGELQSAAALAALEEIAARHPNPQVGIEAVEAIGDFKPAVAVPRLRAAIWEGASTQVRREAVETLAGFETEQSLTMLDDVAARHPDAEVAREALESIAGFAPWLARPRLERIVRTHPRAEMRAEATEQLGTLAGPDEDHDEDHDVDHDVDVDSDVHEDVHVERQTERDSQPHPRPNSGLQQRIGLQQRLEVPLPQRFAIRSPTPLAVPQPVAGPFEQSL